MADISAINQDLKDIKEIAESRNGIETVHELLGLMRERKMFCDAAMQARMDHSPYLSIQFKAYNERIKALLKL